PLLEQETNIAVEQEDALAKPPGRPSEFACPACGGVLNEVHEGKLLRFRCRVGHAYTPASLSSEQRLALEGALWASLRALEEQATLNRRLAARARERGQPRSASRFEESCAAAEDQARIVREALSRGSSPGSPPPERREAGAAAATRSSRGESRSGRPVRAAGARSAPDREAGARTPARPRRSPAGPRRGPPACGPPRDPGRAASRARTGRARCCPDRAPPRTRARRGCSGAPSGRAPRACAS